MFFPQYIFKFIPYYKLFQMTMTLELIISHEEQALYRTHHELVVSVFGAGMKGTRYVAQLYVKV